MKTRFILAAAAIAAMASCTVAEPETAEVVNTEKVFRATLPGGDTRTQLQPDGGTVHVLWNSGDAIKVFGMLSGGSYYKNSFTTADGGSASADFECHSWSPSSSVEKYYAFYPASEFDKMSKDSDNVSFVGVSIPPVQTAVKGGVASDLLWSYAVQENSMAEDLKFQNMLSLLRFRIAGASAGDVRSIKFTANANIAGDGIYALEAEQFRFNVYFPPRIYEAGQSVELIGPFESGEDYYIAFAPCTSKGFTLNFIDGYGNVIVKRSSKTVDFRRSGIADLGTITLDEVFGELPDNVIKYMESSRGHKPVVIAVTGDGFTTSQQSQFIDLAKSGIDFLFDTEPYKTYKDFFTVYILPVVSNESGASVTDGSGNVVTARDTYFSAAWGQDSYSDMDSDKDKLYSYVSSMCPEIIKGTHTVDEVPVILIINDERYGGICHYSSLGRGIAHVPYSYNGGNIRWSYPGTVAVSDSDVSAGLRSTTDADRDEVGRNAGDWRNTLLHEFGGHCFGRLADEYWNGTTYSTSTTIKSHDWTVPAGLNVSGSYDNVPWQEDLLDNMAMLSSIDSRYPDRIGRFQGGDTYPLNRWRSEKISCMIDNRQYFSAWQRDLIVRRIFSLAGETFSFSDFIASDVTVDPVREGTSGAPRLGRIPEAGAYHICPPLPPPVPHED